MNFIGIDPGISGAITILKENGSYLKTINIPIIEIENSAYKHWYDKEKICNIFKKYKNSRIAIEYQRPTTMTGNKRNSNLTQGVVAAFRTGRGFGLLEGLLYTHFDHYDVVDPNRWQNYLVKNFLTKEEIKALKPKTLNYNYIIEQIEDEEFLKRYSKYVTLKSYSPAKKKTLYLFYKILKKENSLYGKTAIDIKWNNNNKIDSFLIAKYCFYNYISSIS